MNFNSFEKDFNAQVESLEENPQSVSEPQADLIMFELGFINEKSNDDVELGSEVVSYVKQTLQDGSESQINLQDLKTILSAVLNFEFDWMLSANTAQDGKKTGGFDKNGRYKVTPKAIQHLHKRFF